MHTLEEFEDQIKNLSVTLTYVKNEKEYQVKLREEKYTDFITLLEKYGMSYTTRHSESTAPDKRRISWSTGSIPYSGTPFIIESYALMQCVNGPKYFGQKKESLTAAELDHGKQKHRRFRLQPSKKTDCSASMKVIKIKSFEEFCIKGIKSLKYEKLDNLKNLKEKLKNDSTSVTSETFYYISFSVESEHNHSVWTTFMNQTLDDSLKVKIQELVNDGITNIQTIKTILKSFVQQSVGNNVCSTSRAFFPSKRIIRNHVLKYIYANRQSKIDQIALASKINQWRKEFPDNNYFYRPYYENPDENISDSFLFCFQAKWQRDLLSRYGSIVLLDSTYKTTKYSIPLFSIVVKTNVNYIVAGIFALQWETSTSIAEALEIFKQWMCDENFDWKPTYFLTDYCDAEINAITSCFNCPVYICDFHRKRGFGGFLKKKISVTKLKRNFC